MRLVYATERSGNRKLGNAAATYVSQASCPSDCVFLGAGCYAERGNVGMHASRLGTGTALEVAKAEAAAIDRLETTRPLRLHVVGDCPTDECALIVSQASERFMARGGGQVWTYTHGWRTTARRSWGQVSVLASCETPADVVDAHDRGYATAVVVDEYESEKRYDAGGIEVIPCPAQTRHVPCSDCRLCFDDRRLHGAGATIGFEIHGDRLTQRRARDTLGLESEPFAYEAIARLDAELTTDGIRLSSVQMGELVGVTDRMVRYARQWARDN